MNLFNSNFITGHLL